MALCISCYAALSCDKRIEADWMGILVGVLSLLVTVLIGWNIYSLIDFNRSRKELEMLKVKMDINTNASLALKDADVFMIYHYLVTGKDPLGLEYRYIHSGLTCLSNLSKMGNFTACNVVVQAMIESIKRAEDIFILQSLKEELLSLLSEVQQSRRIKNFHEVARIVALIRVKGVDDFQ